jgi:hypothetical protein
MKKMILFELSKMRNTITEFEAYKIFVTMSPHNPITFATAIVNQDGYPEPLKVHARNFIANPDVWFQKYGTYTSALCSQC